MTVKCVPNRRSKGSWTVSFVPKRRSEVELAASFPPQRRSRANLPLRILQNVGPGRTGLRISISKRGYRVQRCCFQPSTAIVCKTVAGATRQGSINGTKLLSVQLNDQGDKGSSVDGYRREISSTTIIFQKVQNPISTFVFKNTLWAENECGEGITEREPGVRY